MHRGLSWQYRTIWSLKTITGYDNIIRVLVHIVRSICTLIYACMLHVGTREPISECTHDPCGATMLWLIDRLVVNNNISFNHDAVMSTYTVSYSSTCFSGLLSPHAHMMDVMAPLACDASLWHTLAACKVAYLRFRHAFAILCACDD